MSNPRPDPHAKKSEQAVWSLVLGILSNTCLWILGSIPAIILGVLALKKIDQSEGKLTGRGLAISGIVTGSVGVIVGIVLPLILVGMTTAPVNPRCPIDTGRGWRIRLTRKPSSSRRRKRSTGRSSWATWLDMPSRFPRKHSSGLNRAPRPGPFLGEDAPEGRRHRKFERPRFAV